MAGGRVKGGEILGEYPYDITKPGPLNVGRGRIMPTTPWEAVWSGVVEWLGVDPADIDTCLPNAVNTILSVQRRFPFFKGSLKAAWESVESWKLDGPCSMRVPMPKPVHITKIRDRRVPRFFDSVEHAAWTKFLGELMQPECVASRNFDQLIQSG